MVEKILTMSGFVKNETFKETRFLQPPNTTYAIYLDSFTRRGADGFNLIKEHTTAIELYSYKPDPNAEARIEKSFDDFGIEYEKDERIYHASEGLYEVVYRFDYIEK